MTSGVDNNSPNYSNYEMDRLSKSEDKGATEDSQDTIQALIDELETELKALQKANVDPKELQSLESTITNLENAKKGQLSPADLQNAGAQAESLLHFFMVDDQTNRYKNVNIAPVLELLNKALNYFDNITKK